MPQTYVSNVVAGYGNAAISAPITGRRALGTLDGAWVITYQSSGPLFCPVGLPAGQSWLPNTAFIFWHGVGVSYTGPGSWCGPTQAASASYASDFISIPWQTESSSFGTTTIRYSLPLCATTSTVDASAADGGQVLIVTVNAVEIVDGRTCQSGVTAQTARIHSGSQTLAHSRTGLVPGIFTIPGDGFAYSTTSP
jgi:hypothetical protein